MTIRKEDIYDLDILDADELASDGYSIFASATVVSTTSGTNIIEIDSSINLLYNKDTPVESGDRVYLTETSGGLGDGYYIINEILTSNTFSVNENIGNSTDGYIDFMYISGASQIGFDSSGLSTVTSNNLQSAVRELAENATGISANQHRTLRHLIHFINEGPGEGFASGAYKEILPEANPFPTSIIWYVDSEKSNKIVEKTYTYNDNKTPNTIEWKIYDISNNLIATVTDTISYSGIFEISRIRTIV